MINQDLGIATAYGYAKSKGYAGSEDDFATLMANYASVGTSAAASALKSEGFAVGEQNGTPVSSGSDYYQNNAKYYVEQIDGALALAYSSSATYEVGDYVMHSGGLYRCISAISTAEAWTAAHWTQVAMGDEVADLKTDLDYSDVDILQDIFWCVGTIDGTGAFDDGNNTRIRTINYIDISNIHSISFEIENGYKFGWHFYDSNKTNIANASSFITSNTVVTVPSNAKYLTINMGDAGNNGSDIKWGNRLKAYCNLSTAVQGLLKSTDDFKQLFELEPINLLKNVSWAIGTVNSAGMVDNTNLTKIRTDSPIVVSNISEISFTISNGYKFGWHFYDSTKAHISSASAYVTQNLTLSVPSNAKYLMINISDPTGSASGNVEWANNLTGSYKLPLTRTIDGGVGSHIYKGEKINLTPSIKQFTCDIKIWKEFKLADIPNIADYHLNENQSIAVYGGYAFIFNNGGGVAIVNYSTKNIIDYLVVTPTESNHQNSAQFSDIYYDDNDEFPLLFVSRCGNTVSGSDKDTCLVYRVTHSGNDFTFTLVNTIDCDIRTYGNSWSVDVNSRTLTMVGYVNATYQTTINNPIKFYTWEIPSTTDILSGNTITLQKEKCIAMAEIPYKLLQSACSFGGITYIGIGDGSTQYVYAIDVAKGLIYATVALVNTNEVEGVSVYDGKMYISHRVLGDTIGTNPLQIYELTF